MADTYQVIGTRPGTEFLGGTNTRPVVVVEAATKPNGIYFEFNIPQKDFTAQSVAGPALSWSTIYETVAGLPWVTGVQWSEAPNVSQELAAQVTITVASSSGNSESQLTFLVIDLGPKLQQAAINNLHKQLDDAEGL